MKKSDSKLLFRFRLVIGLTSTVVLVLIGVCSGHPRAITFGSFRLTDPSPEAIRSWAATVAPTGSSIDDVLFQFFRLGVRITPFPDLSMDSFTEDYGRTAPAGAKVYMGGATVEYWFVPPKRAEFRQFYVFVDANGRVLDVKVNTTYTRP